MGHNALNEVRNNSDVATDSDEKKKTRKKRAKKVMSSDDENNPVDDEDDDYTVIDYSKPPSPSDQFILQSKIKTLLCFELYDFVIITNIN